MIKKYTLSEHQRIVRAGKEQLLVDMLERIEYLKKSEQKNQAFLPEANRTERLKNDLEQLYLTFPDPKNRPPLFGLLVGIKDLFRTDGLPTRAGSALPAELFSGSEAESVSQLKQAGALVLGKTVSTEFAFMDAGPTKNPHNLAHTPGGSSSGSAAAVAMGLTPAALGTQTIGSVIRPAAFCGVFGFKPSYDRISRQGVVPFADTLDHVGLFTQSLPDARQMAALLCDDWQDKNLKSSKIRIGIPIGDYMQNTDNEIKSHFDNFVSLLKNKGFEIEHINFINDFQKIKKAHWDICAYEFAGVHKAWFADYEHLYRTNSKALIEKGRLISESDYKTARETILPFREQIHQTMNESGTDIILCPSTAEFAPKGLQSTGNSIMNLPWTYAGLPAVNIPYGKNALQLPFGVQAVGKFMQDEKLFQMAEIVIDAL